MFFLYFFAISISLSYAKCLQVITLQLSITIGTDEVEQQLEHVQLILLKHTPSYSYESNHC